MLPCAMYMSNMKWVYSNDIVYVQVRDVKPSMVHRSSQRLSHSLNYAYSLRKIQLALANAPGNKTIETF